MPRQPARGRPKANTVKKVLTFYLDREFDADFLAFLERNPTRQAQAVLRAWRTGIQPDPSAVVDDQDHLAADDLLSSWDF